MERMIVLGSRNPLSLLMVKFGVMPWNDSCARENCSGHGECHNGSCLCEIQFDGTRCHVPNFSYYAGFASMFFVLALVCLSQLILCVLSEWRRMKHSSLLHACRPTTQKVLYFVVFLAALIRAVYFTSWSVYQPSWSRSLESAYYPLVLSGFSLIVCFWAEVFHLRNVCTDKPQFLSKSFLAFVVFNVLTYSLLLVEFVTAQLFDQKDQNFYTQIFNGCYAFLLFIVLIFFLIYGIEVFFKVRGSFINENRVTSIATGRRTVEDPCADEEEEEEEAAITTKLFECSAGGQGQQHQRQRVNTSQLHQSRFGLLSQAFMLFVVVAFLLSKTLSEFWKSKVPLYSRNWHDVAFRVIEVGIVMWFPCVLWNCIYPEQLWILNPRRLLHRREPAKPSKELELQDKPGLDESRLLADGGSSAGADCWICYDGERQDVGPLIKPCRCTGDVAVVHHDCLRRWLVESSMNVDNLSCKVCGSRYNVEQSSRVDWQASLTARYWLQTTGIIATMCGSFVTAWVIIQLVQDSYTRMLASASVVPIIYICIKFFAINTVVAIQKAKISSLSIIDAENTAEAQVSTISHSVSIDLAK